MKKNKTTETDNSVTDFIHSVADMTKQKDSLQLVKIFRAVTGLEAKMWGPGIIGFGTYHYIYESGREGDAPLVCFSPRKQAIVLYLSVKFERREELLQKFGKHTTGKGCIYIKKLEDINMEILKEMIALSVAYTKSKSPSV